VSRPHVGRSQYSTVTFSGAGNLPVDTQWIGTRDLDKFFGAELAARGHRAVRDRKAEQDAFERHVAFEYFSRLPLGELSNQHAASNTLKRIANTLLAAGFGRRSFWETRRRVAKLRKEFLQLISKSP
jgi:hypothetical protein